MYPPVHWPQAPTQAKPDTRGSTSLQRKPGVAAPPVHWPQAPTQAKPDTRGSTSLQRKPGVAAPAVCCPDNTTAAAPGIYRPDIAAQGFSTPHVYRPQPVVQQKQILGATVASDPPSNAHIRGADPATDPHSANLRRRNATPQGQSGPPVVVQRMLWNAGKGCWISTFDLTTVIDVNTATITVAATENTFTGGHAEIYLGYLDPNPKEVMLDMIGGNDNRAILRRYNKEPGGISNRGAWWARGETRRENTTREVDHEHTQSQWARCKQPLMHLIK